MLINVSQFSLFTLKSWSSTRSYWEYAEQSIQTRVKNGQLMDIYFKFLKIETRLNFFLLTIQ